MSGVTEEFKGVIDRQLARIDDDHLAVCLANYLAMPDRCFRDDKIAYALKALKAEAAKRGLLE